jgi:hypothetical protein
MTKNIGKQKKFLQPMREVACTLEGFNSFFPKGGGNVCYWEMRFFPPPFHWGTNKFGHFTKTRCLFTQNTSHFTKYMISIRGSKLDTRCTLQSSSNTTSKGLGSPSPSAPITVYKPPFGYEMSNIKSSKV